MSTYETPIPNSPEYLQQMAFANQALQLALAQIAQQRSSTLRAAGYQQGSGGSLSIDPNNLFGGIQSLFRAHAQEDRAAKADYAGRGLVGGVRNQQQSNLQLQHAGQSSAFGQSLDNTLGNYSTQEQIANQQYNQTVWQAQQAALQQALLQQLFNPPVTPPTPGPVAANGTNPYIQLGQQFMAQANNLPATSPYITWASGQHLFD